MKTKAYSYQRFSSMKQHDGDSLKRQKEAANAFCQQFSLELVNTFKDQGVSGFKATKNNFTNNESALNKFLVLVESGEVEKGAVLIVENMDRLSRQSILPCLSKFIEIINQGISLGVISQGKILDQKSITENPMELMLVLVEFARANNESEAKSRRSRSVIKAKLERAKAGELVYFGPQCPSWIAGVKEGKWQMNYSRAGVVKKIYALYLAGQSCNRVARTMNDERVGSLKNGKVGNWLQGSVKSILVNRNVLGWCKVDSFEKDDYYPQIVSHEDFQKVQARLAFNKNTKGGSKTELVPNLFRGLIVCATCNGPIDAVTNYYKKEVKYHYALCRSARNKAGCKCNQRMHMPLIELAVFEQILFKHPSQLAASTPSSNPKLNELVEQEAKAQLQVERMMELATDPDLKDLPAIKVKLKEALASKAQISLGIVNERRTDLAVSELPKATKTLSELLKGCTGNPDAWMTEYVSYTRDSKNRAKLRNLMPNVFTMIKLKHSVKTKDTDETSIICSLVGGEEIIARVYRTSAGWILGENNPKTKKADAFKLKAGQGGYVKEVV